MLSIADITSRLMSRSAFVALFAVLLNALAPTLSYAVAADKGQSMVEMCTSFGLKKVAVPKGGEADTSDAQGFKHCQFCLSAGTMPPTSAEQAAAVFVPTQTAAVVPSDRQIVRNPLLFWSASHKRGPPSLA